MMMPVSASLALLALTNVTNEGSFAGQLVRLIVADAVPSNAGEMSIVFARPLPSWGWFVIVVGAFALGWWSYRRLSGAVKTSSRVLRAALALSRAATLVLLAILVAGPSVRFERQEVERDRLVVLVDRSQSLLIADAPGGVTREAQLASVFDAAGDTLGKISKSKDIDYVGFAGGAFSLTRKGDAVLPDVGTPNGERTDLDSALRQALGRAAGRPVSGVLVLSDGRSAIPVSGEALRVFERDSIPVFTVALGSNERIGDAAIVSTAVPARAFVRDRVPVEVRVDRGGIAGPLSVRLVDGTTGREITRREIPAGVAGTESTGEESIVLDASSDAAGAKSWRVEIVGERGDLVRENDARDLAIEFIDRPVRVLYVEGSSRWEYRYFKNLLLREKDVDSSIMLLSADRDFAQEGNMPIARLPRTKEEFSKYDLFVIGDVPSGFFSPDQLTIMRSEIAERGAGLLWIAGERSTPASWEGTALADLFPFKPPLALEARIGSSSIVSTPVAARLGVMRLSDDEDGWPDTFTDPSLKWPKLRYVQSIPRSRLKPTAEVLARAVGVGVAGEESSAAVTRMRFGAGDVVFVATDEIWRWRYGQGERFPERFWIPLVRLLARESLVQGEGRAELTVAPTRISPGDSVIVSLRLSDDESVARGPASVSVDVRTIDGEPVARVDLARDGAEATAMFTPEKLGQFIAVADDAAFGHVEASFEVVRRDDELRRGDTDHAALVEISRRTGGKTLDAQTIVELPSLLPLRAREIDRSVERTLWDTPAALIALLVLLALEWSGRRLLRLV